MLLLSWKLKNVQVLFRNSDRKQVSPEDTTFIASVSIIVVVLIIIMMIMIIVVVLIIIMMIMIIVVVVIIVKVNI